MYLVVQVGALLILNLVLPTPRGLPILTCRTHYTVSLSEQPLCESSVHWSKACSSALHARMGRGHHLHGLSGTAKGSSAAGDDQKAGVLPPTPRGCATSEAPRAGP